MAHPYRGSARGSVKSKFANMLGSSRGAKHMDNDSVATPKPVKSGIEDVKILGAPPKLRLDRARGGRAKGGTNVTVIVAPSKPSAPPMLPPKPPMAPPMAGPPPAMPPRQMPPGPGAGLPMPRAEGGRAKISQRAVKTQNALQTRINALDPTPDIIKSAADPAWVPGKAKGGCVTGGASKKGKFSGGAATGVGRLQYSRAEKKSK